MKPNYHRIATNIAMTALCACLGLLVPASAQAQKARESLMSPMGRMAHKAIRQATQPNSIVHAFVGGDNLGTGATDEGDDLTDTDTVVPQDDDTPNIAGGQAETSLATDSTGQHIIAGFNDTRGFSLAQTSVSGFMYSDDGGVTWTDGGQLPINTVGPTNIGGTLYPQVFGDPEIVYLGGSTFVYASIAVTPLLNPTTGTLQPAQTMCVHLSTDYGHTWRGPYIVGPCTNPHGTFNTTATNKTPRDAADKEFMGRDPDTGRVMLSWSNFTPFAAGGVEISRTYSDDLVTAAATNVAPTWSTYAVLGNRSVDGQSSIPRFAGQGSNDAYVVWRTVSGFVTVNNSIAISHDNGVTFGPPINLRGADYKPMDHVLGNDRTNNSPGFDVDATGSSTNGNLYVVYTDDNSNDGGDIVVQRSNNGGASFSAPVYVDSRPGNDRAQWFPWVNVDQSTGRVHLFYYDQGIDTTGDISEVTHQYSDDGGVTWSTPSPISDRPFHAGYGNDTGQPNIGDYNESISRLGEFMATFASNPQSINFQNGQPTASMDFPDVAFKRTSTFPVSLRLGTVSALDSSGDGFIDPGETVTLTIPLQSYANAAPLYTGVSGVLTTSTPNVTVQTGSSTYPDVPTLGNSSNTFSYVIKLGHAFVPGTKIELSLAVTTALGNTTLAYTLPTGQAQVTPIYSSGFETVADITGWATSHAGGNNNIPWSWATAGSVFSAPPYNTTGRVFFHQNENDGLSGANTRFERLFSPIWTAPANSDYITLDFDVAYNTEDEPAYNLYAYDGLCVRVTDQTGGTFLLRSVLAEAYAQDFVTGNFKGYPKHLPRNSNANYLQDMSVWAGYSNGWKHVSMKLPGMAGTKFQFRFEYTQDSGGTGHNTHPAYPTAGVAIDNMVVTSVHLIAPVNHPPVANAGLDQTLECVGAHNYVTLDGSGSSDPDGEPISYAWYQGATLLGSGPSIVVDAPHDATTTYTLQVTDAHDNTTSADTHVTIKDTTPPTVNLVGANPMKVFFGSVFTDPGATASDICDGDVTASIVVTGSVNTSAIGSYTLTYTAADGATPVNHGSANRTVKVIFPWSDLLQPINTDGSSIFKLGSTIPVKFQLTDGAAGQIITAKIYVAKVSNNVVGSDMEATSTSAADSGNTFRYSSGQYIFNLATKPLSVGTWQIRVDLGDGELHTVLVSLK